MISVTYRTAVRSTISLPSDWKRQQEQHAVFTMICFLCAFISLSEDKLLHLEENKKETKKWFNALGRSTPFGGTKFGLTRSISNVSENVKPLLVSLKAYSEAEKKDHAKSAKEFFGETNNRNENGYITTDCTKLDFSDHHEGAPGEHRYVDHRDTRGEAAVQVELERYYGGAKALLAQNEAFLKGITEALLLTLHHTRRGEQARRVWTDFNPRPPRGGRPRRMQEALASVDYFNPRPPRGGRLADTVTRAKARCEISIHAPRVGGDGRWPLAGAEGRRFQSTPPAWGATTVTAVPPASAVFQSTPPARGATTYSKADSIRAAISIHAPREGGDRSLCAAIRQGHDFNPRPPRGGRQDEYENLQVYLYISIHAPREGGDRRTMRPNIVSLLKFQSTPPRGGRRQGYLVEVCPFGISIHAPREGGDSAPLPRPCGPWNFNPRPPRGGRRSTV